MRLLNPPQYLAADAYLRFERGNLRHVEQLLRILLGKLVAQAKATHGNGADASPLAIDHFENAIDQLLCREIALTA